MAVQINVAANQAALVQSIQAGVQAYNQRFANQNQINLQVNARGFSQPLGRITGDVKDFEAALAASNARVIAFGASTAVLGGVVRSFKAIAQVTIDVEKNLTDINRVFGLSTQELQKFSTELFNVSKTTASSFKDASQAALEFSRQGVKAEEVIQRTSDALSLARLAGMNVSNAIEALTATVNGFKATGITTTQVLNKLVAVEQNYAVSAGDLAEALSRTGLAAQEAGVNIDELNALVTAAQEKTARGGAVIGNALKTIFTRLQRTETLDQLEDFNIKVRDMEGNILPAVTILKNFAAAYKGLADSQKAQLSEQVAGVYQVNILKSIISDLDGAQSAYNGALRKGAEASNEAEMAVAKLNLSLDALLSQTSTVAQQFAANIGKVTFEPLAKYTVSKFKSLFETLNETLEGESLGSTLGNGFLKGIRNVIAGPGAILAFFTLFKLIQKSFSQLTASIPQIIGITTETQNRKNLEQSILRIMQSQNEAARVLEGYMGNEAAQAKYLLEVARAQTAEYQKQSALAKSLAPQLSRQGVVVKSESAGLQVTRSSGFLPNFEESSAKSQGATSSVRAVKGVGKIGGRSFIANNQEMQIPNFAGTGETAVIPTYGGGMQKAISMIASGKSGSILSSGFLPNFASQTYFKKTKKGANEILELNRNTPLTLPKNKEFDPIVDTGWDTINNLKYRIIRYGSYEAIEKDFISQLDTANNERIQQFLSEYTELKPAQIDQFIASYRLYNKRAKNGDTSKGKNLLVKPFRKNENKLITFEKQFLGVKSDAMGEMYEKELINKFNLKRPKKKNSNLDFLNGEAKVGKYSGAELIAKAIRDKAVKSNLTSPFYKGNGSKDDIDLDGRTINLYTTNAAGGYIPNFADGNLPKEVEDILIAGKLEDYRIPGTKSFMISGNKLAQSQIDNIAKRARRGTVGQAGKLTYSGGSNFERKKLPTPNGKQMIDKEYENFVHSMIPGLKTAHSDSVNFSLPFSLGTDSYIDFFDDRNKIFYEAKGGSFNSNEVANKFLNAKTDLNNQLNQQLQSWKNVLVYNPDYASKGFIPNFAKIDRRLLRDIVRLNNLNVSPEILTQNQKTQFSKFRRYGDVNVFRGVEGMSDRWRKLAEEYGLDHIFDNTKRGINAVKSELPLDRVREMVFSSRKAKIGSAVGLGKRINNQKDISNLDDLQKSNFLKNKDLKFILKKYQEFLIQSQTNAVSSNFTPFVSSSYSPDVPRWFGKLVSDKKISVSRIFNKKTVEELTKKYGPEKVKEAVLSLSKWGGGRGVGFDMNSILNNEPFMKEKEIALLSSGFIPNFAKLNRKLLRDMIKMNLAQASPDALEALSFDYKTGSGMSLREYQNAYNKNKQKPAPGSRIMVHRGVRGHGQRWNDYRKRFTSSNPLSKEKHEMVFAQRNFSDLNDKFTNVFESENIQQWLSDHQTGTRSFSPTLSTTLDEEIAKNKFAGLLDPNNVFSSRLFDSKSIKLSRILNKNSYDTLIKKYGEKEVKATILALSKMRGGRGIGFDVNNLLSEKYKNDPDSSGYDYEKEILLLNKGFLPNFARIAPEDPFAMRPKFVKDAMNFESDYSRDIIDELHTLYKQEPYTSSHLENTLKVLKDDPRWGVEGIPSESDRKKLYNFINKFENFYKLKLKTPRYSSELSKINKESKVKIPRQFLRDLIELNTSAPDTNTTESSIIEGSTTYLGEKKKKLMLFRGVRGMGIRWNELFQKYGNVPNSKEGKNAFAKMIFAPKESGDIGLSRKAFLENTLYHSLENHQSGITKGNPNYLPFVSTSTKSSEAGNFGTKMAEKIIRRSRIINAKTTSALYKKYGKKETKQYLLQLSRFGGGRGIGFDVNSFLGEMTDYANEMEVALLNKGFIPNFAIRKGIRSSDLEYIRHLGGSTGADLVKDKLTSQLLVQKRGASAAHIINEARANKLYSALGVKVPDSQLIKEGSNLFQLTEYIEGKPLRVALNENVKSQLKERFAAISLMGDWDALGLDLDNVIVDKNGVPYQIDSGGALGFRAQGALKGDRFGTDVGELNTLRDRKRLAGSIFGSLSDDEIREQIKKLQKNRSVISKLGGKYRGVLGSRMDNMSKFSHGFIPNFAYKNAVMNLEENLSGNNAVLDTRTGPFPFIRNSSQPNFSAAVKDHGGLNQALNDSYNNQIAAGLVNDGYIPNFAKFSWTAMDSAGKGQKGVYEAEDQAKVIARLKEMGLFPTKVELLKDESKRQKEEVKRQTEEAKKRRQQEKARTGGSLAALKGQLTGSQLWERVMPTGGFTDPNAGEVIKKQLPQGINLATAGSQLGIKEEVFDKLVKQLQDNIKEATKDIGRFGKVFGNQDVSLTRQAIESFRQNLEQELNKPENLTDVSKGTSLQRIRAIEEKALSDLQDERKQAKKGNRSQFGTILAIAGPQIAGLLEQAAFGNKPRTELTEKERMGQSLLSTGITAVSTGASLGSFFGLPGTVIGAVAGGLIGLADAATSASLSLEEIAQESNQRLQKLQDASQAGTGYVESLRNLQELIVSGASQDKIKIASDQVALSFTEIADTKLAAKLSAAGNDVEKLSEELQKYNIEVKKSQGLVNALANLKSNDNIFSRTFLFGQTSAQKGVKSPKTAAANLAQAFFGTNVEQDLFNSFSQKGQAFTNTVERLVGEAFPDLVKSSEDFKNEVQRLADLLSGASSLQIEDALKQLYKLGADNKAIENVRKAATESFNTIMRRIEQNILMTALLTERELGQKQSMLSIEKTLVEFRNSFAETIENFIQSNLPEGPLKTIYGKQAATSKYSRQLNQLEVDRLEFQLNQEKDRRNFQQKQVEEFNKDFKSNVLKSSNLGQFYEQKIFPEIQAGNIPPNIDAISQKLIQELNRQIQEAANKKDFLKSTISNKDLSDKTIRDQVLAELITMTTPPSPNAPQISTSSRPTGTNLNPTIAPGARNAFSSLQGTPQSLPALNNDERSAAANLIVAIKDLGAQRDIFENPATREAFQSRLEIFNTEKKNNEIALANAKKEFEIRQALEKRNAELMLSTTSLQLEANQKILNNNLFLKRITDQIGNALKIANAKSEALILKYEGLKEDFRIDYFKSAPQKLERRIGLDAEILKEQRQIEDRTLLQDIQSKALQIAVQQENTKVTKDLTDVMRQILLKQIEKDLSPEDITQIKENPYYGLSENELNRTKITQPLEIVDGKPIDRRKQLEDAKKIANNAEKISLINQYKAVNQSMPKNAASANNVQAAVANAAVGRAATNPFYSTTDFMNNLSAFKMTNKDGVTVEDQRKFFAEELTKAQAAGNAELGITIQNLLDELETRKEILGITREQIDANIKRRVSTEREQLTFYGNLKKGFGQMEEQSNKIAYAIAEETPARFADGMTNALMDVAKGVKSIGDAFTDMIINIGQNIMQEAIRSLMYKGIGALGEILPNMAMAAGSSAGSGIMSAAGSVPFRTGGLVKMQNGGFIRGQNGFVVPGTGTGDKIPALLEPNEYVVNSRAAQIIGHDNLDALNFGMLPRFATGGGFATQPELALKGEDYDFTGELLRDSGPKKKISFEDYTAYAFAEDEYFKKVRQQAIEDEAKRVQSDYQGKVKQAQLVSSLVGMLGGFMVSAGVAKAAKASAPTDGGSSGGSVPFRTGGLVKMQNGGSIPYGSRISDNMASTFNANTNILSNNATRRYAMSPSSVNMMQAGGPSTSNTTNNSTNNNATNISINIDKSGRSVFGADTNSYEQQDIQFSKKMARELSQFMNVKFSDEQRYNGKLYKSPYT